MKLLFIANLVPFPLDGGGKIKTFTALESLSKENEIDLVCFYEKENITKAKHVLEKYCKNVYFLPIRVTTAENIKYIIYKAVRCLFTGESLSIYKYIDKAMKHLIIELVKKNNYDAVYYNYLHVYVYSKCIKKINSSIKHVLDTQNCETAIFSRRALATLNPIKKFYLKIEAKRLGRFGSWAINDCDKLILLSQEDMKELSELNLAKRDCDISIIPIGVQEPESLKRNRIIEKSNINILFIGTMTWAPNNEGIIWFLEKVMERLVSKYPGTRLYIVGKNPSDKVIELSKQFSKNIIVTGYVDSVDEYFDICDFCIVPLFFGSGQRVKIIESFSRGMPVISTSIGAEGLAYIDRENILIADNADDFINCVDYILPLENRNRISISARNTYERLYSIDAVGTSINRVISSVYDV